MTDSSLFFKQQEVPMGPPGIEPGISRVSGGRLNHCRTIVLAQSGTMVTRLRAQDKFILGDRVFNPVYHLGSNNYNLYLIFRRNSLRHFIPSAPSMPFGFAPSITPIIPLPDAVSATTTSTGFAVAQ